MPGRHRKLDIPRQPNGQPSRRADVVAMPVITPAMARRVAGLGVSAADVATARSLCRDPATGTALGRLMWDHSTGERKRRELASGDPVITDSMALGADLYIRAYARWRAAHGIPSRAPRALWVGGEGAVSAPSRAEVEPDGDWLLIQSIISQCPAPRLVAVVLDGVLIDNDPALLLDRPQALAALRSGLAAIWRQRHRIA